MAEVHLSAAVAAWVIRHGGVSEADVVHKNAELFQGGDAANNTQRFLTPSASRELQNGAVMARLLASLFSQNKAECPILQGALAPGVEAATVLGNWKGVLLPVLRRTFAIELSPDKLALLVSGDAEVLRTVVETLYGRAKGLRPVDDASEDAAAPEAEAAGGRLTPFEAVIEKLRKRFDADVQDTLLLLVSQAGGGTLRSRAGVAAWHLRAAGMPAHGRDANHARVQHPGESGATEPAPSMVPCWFLTLLPL